MLVTKQTFHLYRMRFQGKTFEGENIADFKFKIHLEHEKQSEYLVMHIKYELYSDAENGNASEFECDCETTIRNKFKPLPIMLWEVVNDAAEWIYHLLQTNVARNGVRPPKQPNLKKHQDQILENLSSELKIVYGR
jgi:hypothetical protein